MFYILTHKTDTDYSINATLFVNREEIPIADTDSYQQVTSLPSHAQIFLLLVNWGFPAIIENDWAVVLKETSVLYHKILTFKELNK